MELMLGKGLESLIPKKGNSLEETPQRTDRPLAPAASGNLGSRHDGSDFVGDQSHRGSETFFGVSPVSKKESVLKPVQRESVFQIEVERIKPNPYQPRREFDKESLVELAQSIREFGIIQPIVVTKLEKEAEHGTEVLYQLIAGERRLMASKLAGLERVPAIVKRIDEKRTKLELALVENVQRSNLNPVETAKAYARLQDEFNLTQREIATRVGKSREVVANTLRLLNLPRAIQDSLSQGKLNESQARTLLAISSMEEQQRAFQNLLNKGMSVRALREEAKKPAEADPESLYWEKKLEEILGAPVKLVRSGGRGKMVVQFYSEEEWRGILEKLLGDSEKTTY